MIETTLICPYFGGVTQKGNQYLLKCCNDFLSFGTKAQADEQTSKVCEKQMDNCRPFLFRKLKEMGLCPTSEWTTESLKAEYLKQKQEGGNMMDEITTTTATEPIIFRTPVVIATEINSIKEQTRKMVLFSSIEIGRRLVEAKEVVAHGEWGNWLKETVGFSQSTANNLMKIFQEYGSDQISFFGDNAKSQALGNLSYTQAVLLLGIPDDEREEFIEDNDVQNMSTRELQQAIKERDEAIKEKEETEDRIKRIEDERAKLEEDLSKEKDASKQQIIELEASVEEIKRQLIEAGAAGNNDEVSELQESLETTGKELSDSLARIVELERQLKEEPIEVSAAEVIEKVPEETERELQDLRQKNKELEVKAGQNNNQSIAKFSVVFESLVKGFSDLIGTLGEIKEKDPEAHEKYRNAVTGLIGKMSERL